MTLSSSVPQWLNFATGVVDSEDPSLDNRLGVRCSKTKSLLDQEASCKDVPRKVLQKLLDMEGRFVEVVRTVWQVLEIVDHMDEGPNGHLPHIP